MGDKLPLTFLFQELKYNFQADFEWKTEDTMDERVSKGYGIVSEILAILDEIPLGQYRLEMGLKLRQAMLLNGVIHTSESQLTSIDLCPP